MKSAPLKALVQTISSPPQGMSSQRRLGSRQPSPIARTLILLVTTLLALAPPPVVAQSSVVIDHLDPATGYRIAQYRAPTPQTVPGGTLVTLETLQALVRDQRATLIDVTPSQGAGADPVTGAWHLPKPHANMAGTTWLPDVGKGTLSPALASYFKLNLRALTKGDPAHPVIIYCQADCWMSWNAIKRASSYGYTALYWYPDGTDGMRDWDVPLVPATPVSMKPSPP